MTTRLYRKKSCGFSLVEVLLTVMILSILGGMVMLSFGRSEDGAQAARIKADLEALKSAILAYSHNESWNRAAFDSSGTQDAGMLKAASLDQYLDRKISSGFEVIRVNNKLMVGLINPHRFTAGVRNRVERSAKTDGLYNRNGSSYTANQSEVFMIIR